MEIQDLGLNSGPFSDLSICAIVADAAACGHYRIIYPMEFLRRGGANVMTEGGLSLATLDPYDVIIAQRQHDPDTLRLLLEARMRGKTLIYEIDDNVHRVHPNSPAFTAYKPGGPAVHGVQKFMEASDGLFTSSPELASQYACFNKRTWVLPNCIDFGIRDWETPVPRDPRLEDKLVIGWAGSITHQDDWVPLKGVMDKVLDRYPQVVFAIVSAYQTMEIFTRELNLPPDRVVTLDPTDFNAYPALPAQFDIGLIPVIPTVFNVAKSPLKILEYGARGVPYVASSLAPYVRFHTDTNGQGGYIARNQEEWIEGISKLVEDEEDRKTRANFILNHIKTEYAGASNAWRWAEAIRECKAARLYTPEVERVYKTAEKPGRNSPCPCGRLKEDGKPTKYKNCCSPAWG